MIIKSFTAATVAAALKLIREEMGSDAVICAPVCVVRSRAIRLARGLR